MSLLSQEVRSVLNLKGLKAPRNHKISVFLVRNWQLYCPEGAASSGKDMDIAYLNQRRGIRRFTEASRETGSGETGCAIACYSRMLGLLGTWAAANALGGICRSAV